MEKDCLFCRIAAKEINSDIVFEDDTLIAFKDINPQAPVHILIIPKEHIISVGHMDERHAGLAGKMILLSRDLAEKQGILEKGFRLVFNCNRDGGQMVDHIHLHLIGGRAMTWPPG
jgi:histidine triad (HIT) family protein